MAEEMMREVGPSRIAVAYESLGEVGAPTVLLIMGGGAQLIHWPDEFCAELVARELRIVRFDNRDTGRSTHFPTVGTLDFDAVWAGDFSQVPYTLADMAGDAIGLLDALAVDSAHVVGMSLGGMIAQTMAIEYPARIRSLTSIASTTGDSSVGESNFAAIGPLGEPPSERAEFIAWQVRALRAVSGTAFEFDAEAVARRAGLAFDRGYEPAGMGRQGAAVAAYGDRTARLRELRLPTLVIHGTADIMIGSSGGRATAAAIPGAELEIFDGMGHGLPRELWSTIADRIADLVHRTESARAV
ncbi:alpha/beta hydrolase [Nocardia panacis]|uniref:Alpha/beta hydrolase n=1 Tax=Nocardia panacis TaxID=2340916 RepID=A0A3A4KB51_9NOCA|nr:alpha/beta hydrolase [Nocardia panacis]RJO69838.1 alpha/beta hydrolase [Nocardia panacis]